ncbi:hypothetical protein BCR34DRAFT_608573 [Clohesyomyces aquaticus]|uniref:Zn(2)-C6 fungal-type domain-containing protein n=1 Tax=Clohesyomyces aquaticus TaxID=1231657 RepID=A0A1Y1Y713_9PLEO|nr:hypothetical protein BCR34DRAFT_608573 [Clohesyomyces aquaticus]
MVGVPGRSKGCQTCRKRKVKCDETKPICQRCTKAGYNCLGYERERIWMNISTAPISDDQTVAAANQMERTSPPRELSLVAFQSDFCFAYMFANHVWRSSGGLWLKDAAGGKFGSLSLNATTALSQANFGRSNHQPIIERGGIQLYGQCLAALGRQLGSLNQGGQALIVPILVLLMHAGGQEDRTGCAFHLRGMAKLLHVSGPESYQEQPLLDAFEAARAIMLVPALMSRQRLFLDDKSWRTIPWLKNPTQKSPQSELLDILIMVPALLQELDALGPSNASSQHHWAILDRVKEQLALLYSWRWQWQALSGHEITAESDHANPFPGIVGRGRQIRFRRFLVASELMLYNATLMWLLALLFKIDPFGAAGNIEACGRAAMAGVETARSFQSFEPLRRPGGAVNLRDPALEICRAFEWISRHHDRSNESTYLYLFPVGMAMTALQDDGEAMAWIKSMLNESPVTAFYGLGTNQAGFGFYLSREAMAAPGIVQLQEPLFSEQDMEQLKAIKI